MSGLILRAYDGVRSVLDDATRTPDEARLLGWRLGMALACSVEFAVFMLTIRVASKVARVSGATPGTMGWFGTHYLVTIALWLVVVAVLWRLMRIDGAECVVLLCAIVVHLLAIAAAAVSIVA